jgi:hypothetical protein
VVNAESQCDAAPAPIALSLKLLIIKFVKRECECVETYKLWNGTNSLSNFRESIPLNHTSVMYLEQFSIIFRNHEIDC